MNDAKTCLLFIIKCAGTVIPINDVDILHGSAFLFLKYLCSTILFTMIILEKRTRGGEYIEENDICTNDNGNSSGMSFVTYAVAARSNGLTMWVVLLERSASVAMVFRALLLDSGQRVAGIQRSILA
jgi:hypothetical protein